MREPKQTTTEQLAALKTWASRHGRTWKQDLRHAWMSGDYGCNEDISGYLQQVRNSLGPAFLNQFTLQGEARALVLQEKAK
jgi:hypothetical protein